ncbi:hypothetical protein NVV94_03375 [Pseudomonas sp. LS1212]|uniref:hypothetical protein n=1 Tax=Pseudomonas sp. LS1212 TaxID=2972478 RepID=UPI00215C39A1|nr:hypothetical protein [Pseudomonas sp. LS1212]UVJ44660.1 hypothetical protein NVV94_03375 [Pseudomonas sp. LS1212]
MDNSMLLVVLKLSLVFGPLFVSFIGVGVNCYIACRDLDVILNNFKNSYVITSCGGMWEGGSFFARCMLTAMISGGVLWPNKHIRNGSLDPEELARLPVSIKLRMKWSVGLMFFGLAWLFVVAVIVEFFK